MISSGVNVNIGRFVTANIRYTVKGRPMIEIDQLYRRLLDLSPALETIPERVIFPSVDEHFATEGRGRWRFKGYQSDPPMISKRGLMKRGLTARSGLNRLKIDKQTLTFELNEAFYRSQTKSGVFYPGVHQTGGKRHFKNPVLELQPEDEQEILDILSDYVDTGKLRAK